MDRRSWTLLLVLAAIWGSSYMFVKVALDDLDSEMIAWARCALAAVVLVPLAHSRGALRGLGAQCRSSSCSPPSRRPGRSS